MVLNASAPGNVAAPIHFPAWQKAFFSVFSGNGAKGGKAHFQAAFIFPGIKILRNSLGEASYLQQSVFDGR